MSYRNTGEKEAPPQRRVSLFPPDAPTFKVLSRVLLLQALDSEVTFHDSSSPASFRGYVMSDFEDLMDQF